MFGIVYCHTTLIILYMQHSVCKLCGICKFPLCIYWLSISNIIQFFFLEISNLMNSKVTQFISIMLFHLSAQFFNGKSYLWWHFCKMVLHCTFHDTLNIKSPVSVTKSLFGFYSQKNTNLSMFYYLGCCMYRNICL